MTLLIRTEACRGSDHQGHSEGWKLLSRLDTHIRSFFLHTTTDFNLYLISVIYFCQSFFALYFENRLIIFICIIKVCAVAMTLSTTRLQCQRLKKKCRFGCLIYSFFLKIYLETITTRHATLNLYPLDIPYT